MAETPGLLDDLERAYLERAVQAWQELEEGVPLDAIYVLLQARERPRPKGPQGPEPSDLPLDEERLRAANDSLAEALLDRREPPPAPVELAEALQKAPFLVLVGEPGAGKSTTLQYLALTFARRALGQGPGLPGLEEEVRIPVKVDLRTVAEKLSSGESLAIEAAAVDRVKRIARTHAPVEGILEWIQAQRDNGRLLVLLDGLDEVPTEQRPRIREEILLFARAASDCRIVVATRPAGYAPLSGEFQDYDIQPLTDPDVGVAFLEKWLKAWNVEDGGERARKLWETIQATPALRRLSVTPLTLRMLAEVEAREPRAVARIRGRAGLYQKYVEEVVWERAKLREASGSTEERHRARAALERWAWARHVEGLRTERDLRRVLERERLNETETVLPPDDDVAWKGLRRLLREQLGLLVVVEEEWTFAHQTWQEYLVARRLYRAWKRHPKETWRFLKPRLHLPDWREPLHLLVGLLAEEDEEEEGKRAARDFVARVRRAGSAYERHFHRDLRLAVSLAAEIGWLEPIEEGLRHRHPQVRRIAAETLGQLSPETPGLLDALLQAPGHRDSAVRRAAAQVLGQLGEEAIRRKPELLDALLNALDDEHWQVREAAAETLGQLSPETPGLLDALLQALGHRDSDVRKAAAQALGQLGEEATPRKPRLLDGLLQALGDESPGVRQAAVQALGRLGKEAIRRKPELLDALLNALDDEHWQVREAAAETLGQLSPETPGLLDALLQALGHRDSAVRRAAAQALGQLGEEAIRRKPELLDALLNALDDEHWQVREAATETLGRLSPETPALLEALLQALNDEKNQWWVRAAAARALGQLGKEAIRRKPELLDALLNSLGNEDWPVREAAARALGQLGKEAIRRKPELLDALLKARGDERREVREVAAEALGQLGEEAVDLIVPQLDVLIHHHPDPEIRERALEVLEPLLPSWEARQAHDLGKKLPPDPMYPPSPRWTSWMKRAPVRWGSWTFVVGVAALVGLFSMVLQDIVRDQWAPVIEKWAKDHPVLAPASIVSLFVLAVLAELTRRLKKRLEEG